MIHIEGMGWLGAALAWHLHRAEIPFTWHDTDARHVAWRACTGIVYPAGDERSLANLAAFPAFAAALPARSVERVRYGYAHQRPPHEGRYDPALDVGWLRIADAPCYAVNAPAVVTAARNAFAARRAPTPPAGATVIVAHGHTARRTRWMWGWSQKVSLAFPPELDTAALGARVALYGRAHRFAMVYAYPVPGHDHLWWAGSALVGQGTANAVDADRLAEYAAEWRRHFAVLYPGVRVGEGGPILQGWRPRPGADDPGGLTLDDAGRLTFPPLWHSGVRWAPLLVSAAVRYAQTGVTP